MAIKLILDFIESDNFNISLLHYESPAANLPFEKDREKPGIFSQILWVGLSITSISAVG